MPVVIHTAARRRERAEHHGRCARERTTSPRVGPLRCVTSVAGEQLQMCDGDVDRGRHRRDVARGLRQKIAALDGGHERRGKFGHVDVLLKDTFALEPAKQILEQLLPSPEQVLELPAGDRVLIGDLVRQ